MGKDVERLELRVVTDDEFARWARAVALHFGEEAVPERIERLRRRLPADRAFAVFDGDRVVGNAGVFPFEVSLPGGVERPCAGVTAVGVAADWRRHGLLRRMMRSLLDQARERGEPFAALYASESPIYGRFGFGMAAPSVTLRVDTVRAAIRHPVGTDDVELVDVPTALEQLPPIHAAARRQRAGMMSWDEHWWRTHLEHDDPDRRDGMSPRHIALVPGRGFALYRWKEHFDGMVPNGRVELGMLVATDPDAESALWELLFGVDLTTSVTAELRPADDALPFLVDNRAVVQETAYDDLYLRLVDVPTALTARAYAADGQVSFTVTDATCAWNAGTWRLEVRDGTATCERIEGHGDVALDVADLGAIALGGVRLERLVRARRAHARRPAPVLTADRMFAVERAPWNPWIF